MCILLFNEAYPSGSSSVVMTRAVALVETLLGSLEVRLTVKNVRISVCTTLSEMVQARGGVTSGTGNAWLKLCTYVNIITWTLWLYFGYRGL